jgi:hypothetical protein
MVSWTIRLAILAALVYFLRPLYAPPKGTMPATRGANDFVSWTFQGSTNAAVVQTLTLYGDGKNVVLITRAIGDPDLPELNVNWKISRDKPTGLSQFRREGFLSAEKSKEMLEAALVAGVLDLEPAPALDTDRLVMRSTFGGNQREATGPPFVSKAVDLKPSTWINNIRWQKLGNLVGDNAELRSLLAKKEVVLTDDQGKPVAQ